MSDLLNAQVSIKDICNIVSCSERLIFNVKSRKRSGTSLERRPGNRGHNRIRSGPFLESVAAKIKAKLTTSMWKMAKDLSVSATTICTSVKDLRVVSYVHQRQQLLTGTMEKTRVEKGKKLLSWLCHNRSTVWIFSDMKNWTIDQA